MYKKIFILDLKKIIKTIIIFLFILFCVLLLVFSKEVSKSIINSINLCLNVIIPSLFGFMVISNILIKSNIYIYMSRPFYLISKYLFRIPPELFSVFLLANLGGYPIGAKLLSQLLDENKISKEMASTMLSYCYCSGPAFIIGAIGISIFNNAFVGLLIYLSILFSNIIIAIVVGFKNKIPKNKFEKKQIIFNANVLISSIESAVKVLILVCGMIVFFSCLISVLENINFISLIVQNINKISNISLLNIENITRSFFEISRITELSLNFNLIPIIAMLVSFGGVCVILQIIGILNNKIALKKFFIIKPFQMILSAIICKMLIKAFSGKIIIMTALFPKIYKENRGSAISSTCLILMTILLLCKKNKNYGKK